MDLMTEHVHSPEPFYEGLSSNRSKLRDLGTRKFALPSILAPLIGIYEGGLCLSWGERLSKGQAQSILEYCISRSGVL